MLIYKATNTINNKYYIGQTIRSLEKRIDGHLKDSKNPKFYFHFAIKKYGIEKFKWTILEFCYSQKELDEKEMWYIKHFKSFGEVGYNLTEGGSGSGGHKCSEESRKKMSEYHKGKKMSEETKKKMSDSQKGKKLGTHPSDETRKKMSDSQKGKILSEETKKKIGEFQKGNNYALGNKLSKETKKKISEMSKGVKNGFFGKKHTEETKKKISKFHKGNKYALGQKHKNLYQIWVEKYGIEEAEIKMKNWKEKVKRSGDQHGMFGKNIYQIWVEKYGIKEAEIKMKNWKEKIKQTKKQSNKV